MKPLSLIYGYRISGDFTYVKWTYEQMCKYDVYKYKNVVFGSLLFFYTGMMNGTGSIVTGFMTNILGFDSICCRGSKIR